MAVHPNRIAGIVAQSMLNKRQYIVVTDNPYCDFWNEDFSQATSPDEEIADEGDVISKKTRPFMSVVEAFECMEFGAARRCHGSAKTAAIVRTLLCCSSASVLTATFAGSVASSGGRIAPRWSRSLFTSWPP